LTFSSRSDPRDPCVSPIYAQGLFGLPSPLIIAAEYDTSRDEAEAYAEQFESASPPPGYTSSNGMVHGFLQMRGIIPDAQLATEGNRMSLAAMERSQVKTDGHRRWTWPPFRFNGEYFGAVAETNDKHGAAVTSIGNTT
jgi:acetyl esterase/lipase